MLTRTFAATAAIGLLAGMMTASDAGAVTITDYFAPSLQNAPNAAQIEGVIEQTTSHIASLYSNPVTFSIVFTGQTQLPGALGDSQGTNYLVAGYYYNYLSTVDSLNHPGNLPLAEGLQHLATGNAADPSSTMNVSGPDLGAQTTANDTFTADQAPADIVG